MKTQRTTNVIGRPRSVSSSTVGAQGTGPLAGSDVMLGAKVGGDTGDKRKPRNHGGGVSVLSDTMFQIQGTAPPRWTL